MLLLAADVMFMLSSNLVGGSNGIIICRNVV